MPSQLLVGCKKKKTPKWFDGSESVFSFSWEANFNRDGMFTIKGKKKSREGRLLNRSFHVSCLCSGARDGFPQPALLTGHRGPSEHCEIFPFPDTHPTPFLRSAFTPISANFCTLGIPAPQSLRPLPWIFSFSFPPALALEVRGFGCYLCDWFYLPILLPVLQWPYNLYGRDL